MKNKFSRNELDIKEYLDKNGILYVAEYYTDLKDKSRLRFDFYLPDYNCVIECQGTQHFKHFDKDYKPREHIEYVYAHDCMKYEHCKNNEIQIFYYTNIKNRRYIPINYFDKVYTSVEELMGVIL